MSKYWNKKCEIFGVKHFNPTVSKMARVKNILKVPRTILHALWEAGNTQNKITVQVGSS